MTDATLNAYFQKNKDTYMSLAKNCTSVPELLLKTDIYGKRWTQWDWALFFSCLKLSMLQFNAASQANNTAMLYDDIIDAIDNTDCLDRVLTDRKVLCSIVEVLKSSSFKSSDNSNALCNILKHLFAKFPTLWNMSWLQTVCKDPLTKKMKRCHKLKSFQARLLD